MSEVENQATSILLPASTVAVYSKDKGSLQAAKDLENDWRFARVKVLDVEANVDEAIKVYQELKSPDLIIVQTDTIDDVFTARLEELAGLCEEGTSAIVIGPDNDVNLYRRLIDMGVSDYMVKPITMPELAEVVAKALIDKIGVTGSRLIAVIGAKGGVGTSVIAEALACGVSEILVQKTMLLDTAGGWSTLNVGLGFEPSTTLSEAVRAAENHDEDGLRRMIFQAGERLSVLATGGDVMLESPVKGEQVEKLLDILLIKNPVVIADLSHSPQHLRRAVLARANQIFIASTPTLSALRLARSLIQEVQDLRGGEGDDIKLVINMMGQSASNEMSKVDIEKAMQFKVAAYLPYDAKVFLGNESESRKLTDDKVGREIIEKSLLPLVRSSLALSPANDTDDEEGEASFIEGLLHKLKLKA